MKKENTAIRLKTIMNMRGLRQVDILNLTVPYCQKYNVKMNKSDISQYCSGKTEPNQEKLFILGNALNVSEAWLMGYDVPMQAEQIAPSNTYPLDDIKFVNIPVIGSVAAGTGCLADNEIIGYEPTDYDDVKDGQEYRYLTVKGDSMYPKFEEGDLVLVRCQSSVDSGSYAVVLIDDEEGVIKKIVYGPNFIELHSINPMYPVRRFENENVLRIRVFGLVRSIKRKL